MTSSFNCNISQSEALRRYILSTSIIAIFFANPTLPAWITLLSLYPFVTALTRWDPLNALFDVIGKKLYSVGHTAHPAQHTH